jgi:uroporphyrinogen-III synthase
LLPQWDALMFVSPQAVHAFWEAKPTDVFRDFSPFALAVHEKAATDIEMSASRTGSVALACRPRFWAPGPGTAKALLQWGVPADCIDQPPATAAQFDSESLWPVVQPRLRPGMRVLLVRGESDAPPSTGAVQSAPTPSASVAAPGLHAMRSMPGNGRDWLMRQCEAAGVEVHACAAYRRQSPSWGPAQQALARQALAQGAVWLLSSSESLGHLQRLMPAASWQGAVALATHPRIAQAAQAAGFARVWQSRPALADVAQALHAHLARP